MYIYLIHSARTHCHPSGEGDFEGGERELEVTEEDRCIREAFLGPWEGGGRWEGGKNEASATHTKSVPGPGQCDAWATIRMPLQLGSPPRCTVRDAPSKALNLLVLIVQLEGIWIGHGPAGLHRRTRNDLLNRDLDLLSVYCILEASIVISTEF